MKRLQSFLLMMVISVVCIAQAVSPQEALQKARQFLQDKGRSVQAAPVSQPACRRAPGQAAYYVFNAERQQGFVIISGDESTETVLGYADEGTFDEQQMPDNMRAWLQGYAEQISAIAQGNVEQAPHRVATHPAISPLMTTRWNQGDPYNQQCPVTDGSLPATGCVATAMAQVMNYHQYPASAPSVEAYSYTQNNKTYYVSAISGRTLDWNNMVDNYHKTSTTSAQQDAVAWLMRFCGQSIFMKYGPSSGTFSDFVGTALVNKFGYDKNARFVTRDDYTAQSWDELIYGEVSASRPVVYAGVATGGGHAFVCDGYDGKGFYHINWGWGGSHDGFFKLSVMNPNGGGIGSAGTEDGYTMQQGAVVGIQKPTGDTQDKRMLTYGGMYVYDATGFYCYFINRTGATGTFDYGFAYKKADESTYQYITSTYTFDGITTGGQISYQYKYVDVSTLGLSNGTYYFYPYSVLSGESPYRFNGDEGIYMEVVKNGNGYTLTNHPAYNVYINEVTNSSSGITNQSQEIKITLQNNGEEYMGDLYLFATQNDDRGEYVCMTTAVVEAGQTEDVSLYFTPTATGTWHLYVGAASDSQYAIGPYDITIKSAPTAQTSLKTISVEAEGNNIKAKIKNTGTDGYYCEVQYVITDANSTSSLDHVESGNLNLAKGETTELTFSSDIIEVGKSYKAWLFVRANHSAKYFTQHDYGTVFTVQDPEKEVSQIADNHMDGINARTAVGRRYYNLNGQQVWNPQKGIYIVGGKKVVIK